MEQDEIERLENMTLGDMHAQWILAETGSIPLQEWFRRMFIWSDGQERIKKERANEIARQGSEDRKGKLG